MTILKPRSAAVTERSQTMQDSIPTYYSESPEANAIMDANAYEIERKRAEARDLEAQLFVGTATWGLAYWERVLALNPMPNSTPRFRRNRILGRLNGTAPATVAYLTDVVNAHVGDNSARIVEYNGEYRFEAEVNVDQLPDTGEIYRDMDEIKPAHLAFGLIGVIDTGDIIVNGKYYVFEVPYKITNTFQTADVKGGLSKSNIRLNDKTYGFDVLYPITNTFVTSTVTSENVQLNTILTGEYRDNDILYKRAGSVYAGEGDI